MEQALSFPFWDGGNIKLHFGMEQTLSYILGWGKH
jgi:hypothetical protein